MEGSVPEETVLAKEKEVQLSMNEVKFWLQHLDTIQEKGAQKALETCRKRKRTSRRNIKETRQISEWRRCVVCDQFYEDETEEVWIECSQCQLWYHVDCVNSALRDLPD